MGIGGGQDPAARKADLLSPEELSLLNMSPTDAYGFGQELQNRKTYTPEQAAANLKQTALDTAYVTPLLGQVLSAKDAWDYGKQSIFTPDDTEAHKNAALAEFSALAAITGLPFGRTAAAVAHDAPNVANIFAGPKAKTADLEAFAMAKDLTAKGKDPEVVRQLTGWDKSGAGDWRFEVSDKNLQLGAGAPRGGGYTTFSSAAHPELQAAYGDLPPIFGRYGPKIQEEGTFNPGASVFGIPPVINATGPTSEVARRVTAHELNHWVQQKQGWQMGGNPQTARDFTSSAKLDDLRMQHANAAEQAITRSEDALKASDVDAYDRAVADYNEQARLLSTLNRTGFGAYWRTPGEVDARNAARRADMSFTDRWLNSPRSTEDVPRELFAQSAKDRLFGPPQSISDMGAFKLRDYLKYKNAYDEKRAAKYDANDQVVSGWSKQDQTEFDYLAGKMREEAQKFKSRYGHHPDDTEAMPRDLSAQPAKDQPLGPSRSIDAWHGSPHDFEDFKLDKIGTGEGAQSYGHGLYFAENPKVADSYREVLATNRSTVIDTGGPPSKEVDAAKKVMRMSVGPSTISPWGSLDMDAALLSVDRYSKAMRDEGIDPQQVAEILRSGRLKYDTGRLYHATLDVNHEDLLDWDKPLSQQSEKVQAAIARLPRHQALPFYDSGKPVPVTDLSGGHIFHGLAESLGPSNTFGGDYKAASQALHEAGIPGIKYLDQGSRGGAGAGTSNFVIFDDKLVKVKKKE